MGEQGSEQLEFSGSRSEHCAGRTSATVLKSRIRECRRDLKREERKLAEKSEVHRRAVDMKLNPREVWWLFNERTRAERIVLSIRREIDELEEKLIGGDATS